MPAQQIILLHKLVGGGGGVRVFGRDQQELKSRM
jgi:hypothetical protein